MQREILHQSVFAGSQHHGRAAAGYGARGGVNHDVANFQPRLGLAGRASNERPQPREQFVQVERFDEVIIRAGIQAAHALANRIARGEHEHRSFS